MAKSFRRSAWLRGVAASLACGLATVAMAATSSTFRVTAAIMPGCRLSGASSPLQWGVLDFGTLPMVSRDRLRTSLQTSPGLKLMCTPGVSLQMSVNGGLNAHRGQRHLHNGTHDLAYQLYDDAGLTRPIAIDQPVSLNYDRAEDVRLPLHAALLVSGVVPAGVYQDVLTVTLSW